MRAESPLPPPNGTAASEEVCVAHCGGGGVGGGVGGGLGGGGEGGGGGVGGSGGSEGGG